jgi:hypothetical protein
MQAYRKKDSDGTEAMIETVAELPKYRQEQYISKSCCGDLLTPAGILVAFWSRILAGCRPFAYRGFSLPSPTRHRITFPHRNRSTTL